jgi:hypothetical protein
MEIGIEPDNNLQMPSNIKLFKALFQLRLIDSKQVLQLFSTQIKRSMQPQLIQSLIEGFFSYLGYTSRLS